ncbi:hypothetical protein [Corynebacterium sp.]|uniref:hypothetical protein n=1 Tax=Corynebacterium sp. TaxID=1720 RepID=UPI0005B43D24|nr:hypothetical protein [Corynebacterium sp.]
MGRLLLFLLVIVTIVLLWKAFGPQTWGNGSPFGRRGVTKKKSQELTRKGPDDDPDFLWNIEKERFKKRRAQEAKEAEEAERKRRQELREQQRREARGDDKRDNERDAQDPKDPKDGA